MRKIFVLGPNKCGTTSLHKFFCKNGLKSAHWEEGRLARMMVSNISAGLPILSSLEHYDCFSDIMFIDDQIYISPVLLGQIIMAEHPDQVYIFNTRTFESWVKSRENHRKGSDRPEISERLLSNIGNRYDAKREFAAFNRLIDCAPHNSHVFRLEDADKFSKLANFLKDQGIAIENEGEVSVNVTRREGKVRKRPALKKIWKRLQG